MSTLPRAPVAPATRIRSVLRQPSTLIRCTAGDKELRALQHWPHTFHESIPVSLVKAIGVYSYFPKSIGSQKFGLNMIGFGYAT